MFRPTLALHEKMRRKIELPPQEQAERCDYNQTNGERDKRRVVRQKKENLAQQSGKALCWPVKREPTMPLHHFAN